MGLNLPVEYAETKDPAELGYPPTLPIEVAMRVAPVQEIFAAYGLDQEDWKRLKVYPPFVADVKAAAEMLREEGMSFKLKARLQAEELLKTSWKMIHAPSDDVPASVKADLIKFTVRAAGFADNNKDGPMAGNALQINIHM